MVWPSRRGGKTRQVAPLKFNWFELEGLESRSLLSAAAMQAVPALSLAPQAGAGATVDGYTPAQIRHAYGFDTISLGNGIVGTGARQTIAIIDSFDDPNIAADLKTFDKQFSLADPPSFKKVSQTGSTTALPRVDAGWSQEIALDVEWAHAIAPQANILLVEAKSENLNDLMAAVDYARNAAGVSVVSMSWGMSEFRSETSYDSHFTTPSRHTGVTFVAASGDDGSGFGPIWPSISKNVLGVGGTTLSLTGSAGTYLSESAWRDSGGGISRFESVPSYQSSVATSGARSAPDVSYNADPNTGFAVYDSVSFQGDSGWEVIGGTSAGTPQWAALIAIADQGRALIGSAALDGATGTLPAIYALAKTASVYAANFHDIADSQSFFGFNPFGWFGFGGFRRWFFMSGASATTGYDTVTGLGSPRAGNLVAALIKGGASAARATQVARTTTTRMASAARAVTIAGSTLTPALTETFETASVTRVVEDLSPVARPTPAAALTESAALRAAGFSGRLARGSNNIVDGSSIAELKAMPTVIATVGRAVEVVGQKLTSAWRGIDAMRQNWTGAIRQDSVWANVPTPAMKLDLRPESSWRKVAAILAAVATVGAAMRRRSAGRELPGMPRRV